MTPEVKQRIEQIRQGIVPEGYVKDKDGIYPRDWASKKIGQWLKLAERSIVLQDEEEYQLVTIRRGFGGVDSRGSFLGKNVLVKNYFIVKTGDFIISKRQIAHGACGIVLPELDGAVVSNEYNVFLPQDGTNIQMFNLMMQLPHYKRLFYLMSDGVHIEKLLFKTQDWMKRTLAMPLLKEQKKIAEILSTQDKAIELQGRKIEELKRFKKGCLEKMFPRKGQKVPEKRFPGFTDDWEQRKLSEITDKVTEKNAGLQYVETFTNSAEFGIISQRDFFDHDIAKLGSLDGYYIVKNEDFVYNPRISTSAPVGPINRNKLGRTGVMSPLYTVFRPHDIDTTYLEYFFKCGYWHSFMNFNGDSGARSDRFSIRDNVFFQMPIPIPDIDEQRKIGELLTCLDNLITLHQRKLEEMKNQKKALMQLLLTGIVRVRL